MYAMSFWSFKIFLTPVYCGDPYPQVCMCMTGKPELNIRNLRPYGCVAPKSYLNW